MYCIYRINREPRIQYISIVNYCKKLTLYFLMSHEAIEKKQTTAGKKTVKHTVAGRRCGGGRREGFWSKRHEGGRRFFQTHTESF